MSENPESSPPDWMANLTMMAEGPVCAPAEPVAAADLAAHLAARMCHDFISPASAIVTSTNQAVRWRERRVIVRQGRACADQFGVYASRT